MSKAGILRLQKEYKAILKSPPEHIEARPSESDIFHWHFVIRPPAGSPYAGGITMRTPNGRFAVDTRLCLSMSDFHPESWNPIWTVSTILSGLLSFMLEEEVTNGSITASPELRRRYARESLAYNMQDPVFRRLFPHYADMVAQPQPQQQQQQQQPRLKQEPGVVDDAEVAGEDPDAANDRMIKSRKHRPLTQRLRDKPDAAALSNNLNSPRNSAQPAAAAAAATAAASGAARQLMSDRTVDRLIILVMLILLGLLFRQLY